VDKDKTYLYDSALAAQEGAKKKNKKKNTTFGWEVFNDDSLFRAYEKRVKKLEVKNNGDEQDDEEQKKDKLVDEINKQREKKNEYSRRRMHVEEKDIDYINERNKVFNEKLERNFSKFAAEIKGNIERGTAL
jgi:hypothetical protein